MTSRYTRYEPRSLRIVRRSFILLLIFTYVAAGPPSVVLWGLGYAFNGFWRMWTVWIALTLPPLVTDLVGDYYSKVAVAREMFSEVVRWIIVSFVVPVEEVQHFVTDGVEHVYYCNNTDIALHSLNTRLQMFDKIFLDPWFAFTATAAAGLLFLTVPPLISWLVFTRTVGKRLKELKTVALKAR